VRRGGQVYVVHDRVHSIDKIAAYLSKHIPEVNFGVVHGQMKASQLEKVFHEFLEKKFDVLISTKIIESGLDIPNVNTIIVNRADRFGMAELHQLRGRVGRSNRQAYAYLLVPSLNTISRKAVKRLQAIEEFTDLGEGFSLSMRDLEIRGAGNLLGTEQSGAIDSVGFDLYMKMLDEAVEELKAEEFSDVFKELPKHHDRTEPKLDAYFEIGIPKDFMPDQADRLSYYTALFSVARVKEIDEVVEEMEDKFGKLPVNIQRLVQMAKLRYYASFAMFERLVIRKDKVSIILPKSDKEEFYQNKFEKLMQFVMQNYPNEIRFHQKKDAMKFEMQNEFHQPEEVMTYLINFSSRVMNLVTKEEEAEVEEVTS
jgi:transcription-repair coupling factor (superfamily II helicase)